MSTPYQVIQVDLTTGQVMRQLVGPANAITSFTILSFPAGNTSFIRIGQNGQRIPVIDQMQWEYDQCGSGPEQEGLVWEQPAVGAGIAVVAVFMGGGSAGIGV